jgi:hypothetical protein
MTFDAMCGQVVAAQAQHCANTRARRRIVRAAWKSPQAGGRAHEDEARRRLNRRVTSLAGYDWSARHATRCRVAVEERNNCKFERIKCD